MPRDAEAWLAARGIERHELSVDTATGEDDPAPITAHQAVDLARQSHRDEAQAAADAAAHPPAAPSDRHVDDDTVRQAFQFLRRSVTATPQSCGRLAEKMRERGFDADVIDTALEQGRQAGLVDDAVLAVAFTGERHERGHALARIGRDLRRRGFSSEVIEAALAPHRHEDPEAAAFAIANERAARLGALDAEAAFRRVHGLVVRRGYSDAVARKVARQAVFLHREDDRVSGH